MLKEIHIRRTLAELISAVADIPADITDGMTLEMRGRNELLLCGCKEIYEYSRERIRILQGKCSVCVMGRRLTMTSYSDGRITVGGEIDSIDFCGGQSSGEKEK
jgi:sporulation protein YqfC